MAALALLVPLLLLFPLCCFTPGFLLVRALRWSRAETLNLAIGASIILMYLLATAIFLIGASWRLAWGYAIVAVVLTVWRRKAIWRFVVTVRTQLFAYAALCCLTILLLGMIEVYSGGDWTGDWIAHCRRVQFFLQQQPYDMSVLFPDVITSRPPLMNIVTAFLVQLGGRNFESFQVAFTLLNLLAAFPCFLLAGILVPLGGRRMWLISAFLATSPVVLQNATWSWTKLLAAFYVLLSLALYLRGWRRNDQTRIIVATLSMAAALLVHYSAAPYAIALAVHYLLLSGSRTRRGRTIAISSGLVSVLLFTWFAWALALYGPGMTFGSNTTVADAANLTPGQQLAVIAHNFANTFIPHPLRIPLQRFRTDFFQPNRLGFIRDYFFSIFQANLPFSFGFAGLIAVPWLVMLVWKQMTVSWRWFWISFLGITLLLGIGSVSTPAPYGAAHVTLQPLTLLGLTLLAVNFKALPRWVRTTVCVGLLMDLALGVLLHFRVQSIYIAPQRFPDAPWKLPINGDLLSIWAIKNAVNRAIYSLTFFASHFSSIRWLTLAFVIGLLGTALVLIAHGADLTIAKNKKLAPGLLATLFIAMSLAILTYHPRPLEVGDVSVPSATLVESAKAMIESGDSAAGYDRLVNAFLLDPFNPEARYLVALGVATHNLTTARPEVTVPEQFRLNPTDNGIEFDLAKYLYLHAHAPEAIEHLESAYRRDPNDALVHKQLEELMKIQGHDQPWIDERLAKLRAGQR